MWLRANRSRSEPQARQSLGAAHAIVLPNEGERCITQAIERTRYIVPGSRITVVGSGEPVGRFRAAHGVTLLSQPSYRGSAPAALLGMVEVLVADPEAMLLISPSSYHVANRDAFGDALGGAYLDVMRNPAQIVLLVAAQAAGGMRDTQIVMCKGRTLLGEFARAMPRLTRLFQFAAGLPTNERERFLRESYQGLPMVHLARVLATASGLSVRPISPAAGWCGGQPVESTSIH